MISYEQSRLVISYLDTLMICDWLLGMMVISD